MLFKDLFIHPLPHDVGGSTPQHHPELRVVTGADINPHLHDQVTQIVFVEVKQQSVHNLPLSGRRKLRFLDDIGLQHYWLAEVPDTHRPNSACV